MSEIGARFGRHYSISDADQCWLWTSAIGTSGYGRFFLDGKNQTASRVAYALAFGPIPDGRHVLHRCDVRRCVNPNHLYLGDHAENMRDRNSKGRAKGGRLFGKSNPNTKLSVAQVDMVRRRIDGGEKQRAIAIDLGVTQSTISRRLRG